MNKKLFLVLVLVTVVLVAGSLVLAGKAVFKGPSGVVVEPQQPQLAPKIAQSRTVSTIPHPAVAERKAAIYETTGHAQKGAISPTPLSGTPVRLGTPSGKDLCDLTGAAAYFVSGWIYGLEWYANYQDPEEFGCTAVWPFQVTEIDFQLNFPAEWVEAPVYVQGFVFDDMGTPSCPEPEATPGFHEPCSTAVYGYLIPTGGGYFELPMPLTEECCVYDPYFAVVYVWTDLNGLNVDMVSEDNAAGTCRSYNDYGGGWIDLVYSVGFPGPIMLYSKGLTMPQNECPTEGDTCGVSSITPATIQVLPGGTADFTANVYFTGTQSSCNLTVTPDPVCPSCVTTVTPNPVDTPATSATITIVTDPSTPPGTYVFDVNGAKASATLQVLAYNDTCEIARWISAPGYYFDSWSVGDQNAVLLDPAMCITCGPDIYPFNIRQVKSRWVNWTGTATSLDVNFHIFEADTPYCNGPGAEIYQFPATITAWSPTYVTVDLPKVICVDGPFWLSAEYVDVQPLGEPFPALRFSNQTYDVACSQFNYWVADLAWYAWEDFWSPPPPGYLYLSAIGNCQDDTCPITCDLQQDNGAAAGYASWIWEGFQVAKYYDPEQYCTIPVYPYHIHDVDFPIYHFGTAADEANVQIVVYLMCQDSCDGPGPEIYRSPTYNITTFYPSWNHIVLPDPVCVYQPFYIALRWDAGPEPMPSMLMDNNGGMPGDSCHVWYFDPDVSTWYEHYDWWSTPLTVGMTMLRVSGYTNSPDCNFAPCDTTIVRIAGGGQAFYFKTPPNDEFINMRFDLPSLYGGRLEYFRTTFYLSGSHGTPDVDYYVWFSDGTFPLDNNPPYQAVASFHVPYAEIQWYNRYDTLYVYPYNLIFDPGESFHIGWNHAWDPGDTLSPLGDTATGPHRASGWDGTAWEDLVHSSGTPYRFTVDAYVCPIVPAESSFTMKCVPSAASCNPGDASVKLFKLALSPVRGYSLPVTLSYINKPAGITAVITPGSCSPACTSDVAITVDPTLTYGDYVLTFQGVGSDGQTKTANAILTIWDEDTISFYHGQQRISNFGAVANGDAAGDNFVWYGMKPLYDGSFIIATDTTHVALDLYDYKHHGFAPPFNGPLQEHMTVTYLPEYNVNMAAGHYCCDSAFTGFPGVPGECDSVFFIGIMDYCVDFSVKIKVYYNTGTEPITNMYAGVFEDWDVIGDDWGAMDTVHNLIYQYDPTAEYVIFGLMKAPFYDETMNSIVAIHNPTEVYPTGDSSINCTGPECLARLFRLMSTPGYRDYGYWTGNPDDHSILMTAPPFTLAPGEKHIEIWINFGRNTAEDLLTWSQWYHRVLRYIGFYRGDVNASDNLEVPSLDVTDLVYLINYLFKYGPAPKPYADQGDVNGTGCLGYHPDPKDGGAEYVDITDVVYLLNYVFVGGPPPVDYVRFIPQCWSRPSLFENNNWK
jgi:hypothetical protein